MAALIHHPRDVSTASSTPPTSVSTSDPGNAPFGYGGSTGSDSISFANYYYFLIGMFILAILLSYWMFARRRKRALQRMHSGQFANAEGNGQRVILLRRFGPVVTRREEGLNERGEAPPPYMPASHVPGPSTPFSPAQDFSTKPPDYGSEADVMRPLPTHQGGRPTSNPEAGGGHIGSR